MYSRRFENVGRMTTPAERYVAAKLRGQHPVTTEFLLTFDFEFYPFQVLACHAVEDGKGVLVAAPTGAGHLPALPRRTDAVRRRADLEELFRESEKVLLTVSRVVYRI